MPAPLLGASAASDGAAVGAAAEARPKRKRQAARKHGDSPEMAPRPRSAAAPSTVAERGGGAAAAAPPRKGKKRKAPGAPSARSGAAPPPSEKKSAPKKKAPRPKKAKGARASGGAGEGDEATKTAEALLQAASAEQRELQAAEEKARKREAKKVAKKAAKAAQAEEARKPPSQKGETATDPLVHQLLKGVAEDFCIKESAILERAARRELLGPMLAEEPSGVVLAFCRKWRELAHAAYAKAASLPAAQHAEANLALRLGVVGPEVRGALSTAWLAVPEAGGAARRASCSSGTTCCRSSSGSTRPSRRSPRRLQATRSTPRATRSATAAWCW